MNLKDYITEVANWPKQNINFKDITPLLLEPNCFSHVIDLLFLRYENQNIDKIVGIDSRGFIFASALAYKLKKGLVLARKKGKLPSPTISENYDLEYGTSCLEIKEKSIAKNDRIIVLDDVIATGGTFNATKKIIEKMGANLLEAAFVLDIRNEIRSSFKTQSPLYSLVRY